jgi:competence protein ComEC
MSFIRLVSLIAGLVAALVVGSPDRSASGAQPTTLKIVFVDVEGGAATLIVTPMGESVLIDSGWEREDGRDALRIRDAAKAAGVQRIDHLITTHWHMDHYGGVGQLAKLMPIGRFYDHGVPPHYADDPQNFPRLYAAYRSAGGSKSRILKPGDTIKLRQDPTRHLPAVTLRCMAANGHVIDESKHPAEDGCPAHPAKPADPSDNARSLAVRLACGDFRFWAGGDLTWNVEHRLVCPTDRVGPVSLYLTDHHGLNQSNNPALVQAVHPRVAVMNCGAVKGGDIETTAALRSVPGIEAIYQSHRVLRYQDEGNAPAERIANEKEDCQGVPIVAEVEPDGKSFEMRVGWGGQPHRFEARPLINKTIAGARAE